MSSINVINIKHPSASGNAITLAADGSAFINTGVLGARNRIINGDMRIDARNAGASVTIGAASNVYVLDRWYGYGNVASKFSIQQNAGSVTPPPGFSNYLGVTSLSAYSVPSGEQYVIGQRIEGFNTADLAFGTADAKTLTLSFWVRSSVTGTHGGQVNNAAYNRSYPFSFAVSAANTWEYKSVSIPGDTTGTWLSNSFIGLVVGFNLGSGSTFSSGANAWAAGNFSAPTGAVSVVGTNGATFYITGVQLEAGTVATAFERRPYGQELALCQRYYENGIPAVVAATTGLGYTPAVGSFFKVTKRITPTVVEASVFEAVNIDVPTINQITIQGCKVFYPAIYGAGYRTSQLAASAEL